MSDRESWDDEVADLTRDDDDNDEGDDTGGDAPSVPDHPAPPATAQTQSQGQNQAQLEQREPDLSQAKPANQAAESPGRGGKRAQRTRRIKVNPQAAQNPTGDPTTPATPPPTPVTESVPSQTRTPTKAKPPSPQGKTPNSTPADSSSANPGPAQSTPITIPPQITGFQNHDVSTSNEQVLDFDDDEPSRLLDGLFCLAATIRGLVLRVFSLLRGLLHGIGKVLMFPALLGGVLYFALVYLLGRYVLGTDDLSEVTGFEAALKYVLLSAGWTVMPVFAAFVVIHFATTGPQHHQFLYESVIDALLLVCNGLIMSAHGSPDCLIWFAPVCIISAVFRLLYWMSLFYLGNKWQQVFKTPAVINCIMFSTNNLGASLRHCVLGYPIAAAGEVDHTQDALTTESTDTEAATKDQGFMANPSMCRLVEAVFCDVGSTSQ